jgi:hypothetical protein
MIAGFVMLGTDYLMWGASSRLSMAQFDCGLVQTEELATCGWRKEKALHGKEKVCARRRV